MLHCMNLTQARRNLYSIASHVQHEDPVHVTDPNGNNIVILSEDDFMSMQETNSLNSVPGLVETILSNANTPLEEMKIYNPEEEW